MALTHDRCVLDVVRWMEISVRWLDGYMDAISFFNMGEVVRSHPEEALGIAYLGWSVENGPCQCCNCRVCERR
jgi:hypothetical protein